RVLERVKLRQQLGFDARAGLVAGPQVVAERFDDVIGRDAQVGGSAFQHAEDGAQHAGDGADFISPGVVLPGHGKEMPEQLVGAVEEMDFQALRCPNRSARTAGSRSFQTTPPVKEWGVVKNVLVAKPTTRPGRVPSQSVTTAIAPNGNRIDATIEPTTSRIRYRKIRNATSWPGPAPTVRRVRLTSTRNGKIRYCSAWAICTMKSA